METLDLFAVITLAFILGEAVVTAMDVFKTFQFTKAWFAEHWKYLAALVTGIVIAVNYQLDLFVLLGVEPLIPAIGTVLTGIIGSRGSNYLADIFQRIRSWKVATVTVTQPSPVTSPSGVVTTSEPTITAVTKVANDKE